MLKTPDICPPAASPDELPPVEAPEHEDAALIADLRDAFALNAAGLSAGHSRLGMSARTRRDVRTGSPGWAAALGTAGLPTASRLGDFEILEELGRGGMGVVYRAHQVSLGRLVALKVLPGYAHRGRVAAERFRAEAQAAARLHHTNIVAIHAQGEYQGFYYYAMELVDGIGLDTVIRSRPQMLSSTALHRPVTAGGSSAAVGGMAAGLDGHAPAPPPAAPTEDALVPAPRRSRADYRHMAALLAEVADALAHAHASGVIHRDVKPHNLLLGEDGHLHLTDFGLARLADAPHLTCSGEIMGTPAYLSPEQVRGEPAAIDHRTDVYSLGVTLYEMLTQAKPFEGETRDELLAAIGTRDPIRPRRRDPRIPLDLETICLRAIAREPQARHPTAALLADDLRRFADGRPILSRRVTPVVRAAKWVRRHKAVSTAAAATLAAVVLAAGLLAQHAAAQQREGRRLLTRAYDQLAYHDYRRPELARDDLDRAAALGVSGDELELTRALAQAGATGATLAEPVARLAAVVERNPADLRARYLLAWLQRRAGRNAESLATLDAAERRGPPATADAWFFRGLATHYADPATAIDSYRRANALRAGAHGFYPQALLHLARAQNQRNYELRNLEGFEECRAILEQLIRAQHYGAYPHYLLSISHRLAAEIYSGSAGTRTGDATPAAHYEAALHWARAGQHVDPADDRPVTAEAECLESMGRLAEARDARTRALGLAGLPNSRWEALHYRWRLNYWLGDLPAAYADLASAAQYEAQAMPGQPVGPFSAHVYPALLCAEQGDLEQAVAHARAIADERPGDTWRVIWSATTLRLLGRIDEANDLLATRLDALGSPPNEPWLPILATLVRTGERPADLEAVADAADKPWKLWGEAYFHEAVLLLAHGDRSGARTALEKAWRSFDDQRGYTYHARVLLVRMENELAWPAWISVPSGFVPATSAAHGPDGPLAPARDAEDGTP